MARRALLAGVGLLYVLSVPWYRADDDLPPLLFGLPSWVSIALACYVACAVLNAAAWLLTDVPDEPGPELGPFARSATPGSSRTSAAAGAARSASSAAEREGA